MPKSSTPDSKVKAVLLKVLFILISACLTIDIQAQTITTSGAGIGASIVSPVGISKSINTDFGNVALIMAGVVTLKPVVGASKGSPVVLPVKSGTFTIATYNIAGTGNYDFTFSIPDNPHTIRTGSSAMQVVTWESTIPQGSGSGLNAGVYVSVTPSNVTVNYN